MKINLFLYKQPVFFNLLILQGAAKIVFYTITCCLKLKKIIIILVSYEIFCYDILFSDRKKASGNVVRFNVRPIELIINLFYYFLHSIIIWETLYTQITAWICM